MNAYFTVNLIGDGLLQEQFLTTDYTVANRKAIKYYKENREDYIEDGYVKIIKFDQINDTGEDTLTIGFDEELEEIDIDFDDEE